MFWLLFLFLVFCITLVDVLVSLGTIRTIAGGGFNSGNGIAGTVAALNSPHGVYARGDKLWFAVYVSNKVFCLDLTTGILNIVACSGSPLGYSGDNGPATNAKCYFPIGVYEHDDKLFFSDNFNNVVRYVDSAGTIHIIVGTPQITGSNAEGLLGTNCKMNGPTDIYVDDVYLWIVDSLNGRVLTMEHSTGTVHIVSSGFNIPKCFYITPSYIWVSEDLTFTRTSRNGLTKVTVAGTGSTGFNGDNLPGTSTNIDWPVGLYVDAKNLYMCARNNRRVLKLDLFTGTITTVVGSGGALNDNGPATNADLNPRSIYFNNDKAYISDLAYNRIRVVDGYKSYASVLADPHFMAFNGVKYSFSGCVNCLYVIWQDVHLQWNGKMTGRPGLHHVKSRYFGFSFIHVFGRKITVDPIHRVVKVDDTSYRLNRYRDNKIKLGPTVNPYMFFMRMFRNKVILHLPCMKLHQITAVKSTVFGNKCNPIKHINNNYINAELYQTHWSPYCIHPIGLMGDLFRAKDHIKPTGPNGEGVLDHKAEFYRIGCPFCKLDNITQKVL